MGKALTAWTIGMYAYQNGKRLKMQYEAHKENSITKKYPLTLSIDADYEDDLYNLVVGWLYENVSPEYKEKITDHSLVSTWVGGRNHIMRSSNGGGGMRINVDGVDTRVALAESSRVVKNTDDESASLTSRSLVFRCKNTDDLNHITEFFTKFLEVRINVVEDKERELGVTRTRYFNYAGSGGWSYNSAIVRNPDSVILKNGDKERIMDDLHNFVSLKSEYLRLGIPWHRGYLLYGPPGTGKTSLSVAMGAELGLPLFFLSLNDLNSDSELATAISRMTSTCRDISGSEEAILILEDVDAVYSTDNRTGGNKGGVSFGALLNILDGAYTPTGLITFLTTNHRELLDPALIRPGRVDFELFVDYLDQEQFVKLLDWYLPDTDHSMVPELKATNVTPACITGVVKNYLYDPEECVKKITEYVEEVNANV